MLGIITKEKNGLWRALITLADYYPAGSLLRVCFTCESVEDCRFVSDNPAVMSWWNVGHVSWTEFDFLAIVRSHAHPTLDPDSEVVHLTGIRFDKGLDVF
jgi:hypothetical protein